MSTMVNCPLKTFETKTAYEVSISSLMAVDEEFEEEKEQISVETSMHCYDRVGILN